MHSPTEITVTIEAYTMTALLDLERALRWEKLTARETDILFKWKERAIRDLNIGLYGGTLVTWLGTQRLSLNRYFRMTLTLGSGVACGIWGCKCSVESSQDRILSLEGTHIQRELAILLVQRYSHQPKMLERLSKYLYCEKVYHDSAVDRPTFVWRSRNFFGDPATFSQNPEQTNSSNTDVVKATTARTMMSTQQANVVEVGGDMENPLDIIFGGPGIEETPHDPHTQGETSRGQARREKRAQRRRTHVHHHHHEEGSDI